MYIIYDMKDSEQCIGIFEQLKEVAKFFNTSSASISSSISRKEKRNHRYLIERVKICLLYTSPSPRDRSVYR